MPSCHPQGHRILPRTKSQINGVLIRAHGDLHVTLSAGLTSNDCSISTRQSAIKRTIALPDTEHRTTTPSDLEASTPTTLACRMIPTDHAKKPAAITHLTKVVSGPRVFAAVTTATVDHHGDPSARQGAVVNS